MDLVTAGQMRGLDRAAIHDIGIPAVVLMENAGRAVAREILSMGAGEPVTIVAGPGNNGGDGFVVARHLAQAGVRTVCLTLAGEYKGEADLNLEILKKMGMVVRPCLDQDSLREARPLINKASVVVDALFGTGLKRNLEGRFLSAVEFMNSSPAPVVAIDIPSGLCSDTGRPLGAAVMAELTVTMALVKVGHALYPGRSHTGRLVVADIGIPNQLTKTAGLDTLLLDRGWARARIRPRGPQGHKGTYGHVMIIAGSKGKSGAAALCARGALRSGAGLVTVACPKDLIPEVTQLAPEAMTLPLPQDQAGVVTPNALDEIASHWNRMKALAIGPGLGLTKGAARVVKEVIKEAPLPVVADADALTCLGRDHAPLIESKAMRVLTPHPGEMSRLTGGTTSQVQKDRMGTARFLAASTSAVIVLKGADTVVASSDGRTAINSTGGPHLGAGGMGDVLTGLIGGLLAQGMEPWEAAGLGVYAHGAAGDLLAGRKGPWGLRASEVADMLPDIWQGLLRPNAR